MESSGRQTAGETNDFTSQHGFLQSEDSLPAEVEFMVNKKQYFFVC
jgi:hypothetical protein